MIKVKKRDGTLVPFNSIKIANAIEKAFEASKEPYHEGCSTTEPYILANQVAVKLNGDILDIEDIQNAVEETLMENGYKKTAKEYILYRNERTMIREKNTHLMKNLHNIFNDKTAIADARRENANIDGNTAMGTMLKFGSETSKEYTDMFIIKPEHAEAHASGDIHIHDKDFLYMGTTTCTQINLDKLFEGGFNTGHGYLRKPSNIQSATQLTCIAIQSNQNEQHGGQAIPNFDRFLAPYVAKTFVKKLVKILEHMGIDDGHCAIVKSNLNEYLEDNKSILTDDGKKLIEEIFIRHGLHDPYYATKDTVKGIIEHAIKDTEEDTYQAMEAFIHNMNTLHSRAGAQVPFSSINYGSDTSEEARMIVKNLLLATEAGLGNGETPIFPIQIFRCQHGVNFDEGDPNYDLYQLAIRVSAKRLFPNFSFQDAPFNKQYYDPKNPATEIAYMGCRTRVIGNVNGPQETYGRGNLSFTTINLPRLGILCAGDWNKFFNMLEEKLNLVADQLYDRYQVQCSKVTENFPFLMGEGVWNDGEKLKRGESVEEIIKQGTLSIGFIGLAECLIAMMGKHHGESDEAQEMGIRIVKRIREFCDEMTEKTHLNYTCLATPAEGLSGRFVRIDKKKFGVIEGITDKEYYTNSFHVPVYYDTTFGHKLDVEGPYHAFTNAGHISYIELKGDPEKNLVVFDKVIKYMDKVGIGYGAINHPVDRDPVCGFSGVIEGEMCPGCGRVATEDGVHFERIRRITGYLVGTLERFNNAKRAEVDDRVKHDSK